MVERLYGRSVVFPERRRVRLFLSILCPQLTKIVVQTSAFIFFTQDERPCPRKPSFLPRKAGVISSCTDRTEIFLGGRVASQTRQVEKQDTDGL